MQKPIISFIIPVYNAENFLKVLLDSILNEIKTNQIAELIFVNDGSTDQSGTLLNTYASQYNFIKAFHFNNQGTYKARNFALSQAQGHYLWFVDADDYLLPKAIISIVKTIEEQPNAEVITFGYQVEEIDGKSTENRPQTKNKTISGLEYLRSNDGRLYLWNNVYKSSFLTTHQIQFLGKSHSLEDSLFNLQAFAFAKNVYCLNEKLYFYRFNNHSISRNITIENRIKQGESSFNVHQETQNFMKKFHENDETSIVLKEKLAHSVLGFFYSLLKENYPINYIQTVFKKYKAHQLLPAKRKNNNLKIAFFQFCVNTKYPFLLICFIYKILNIKFFQKNPTTTNKTFFIDQTSEGDHHMMFNAAFIEILTGLYPNQKLNYYGIKTSQESVKNLISTPLKKQIKYKPITYRNTKINSKLCKIWFYIFKEIKRLFIFLKIFFQSKRNDVLYLSITTFSSFLLFKLISFCFNRKIFAVLHGDLDFLYFHKNTYEKVNSWSHQVIFKLKNKNFKYIVLNKICKNTLVNDKFLDPTEVIEINHPYFFDDNLCNDIKSFQAPIIFAHNGSMEIERKNSHYIFDLASQLCELISSNDIAFKSIGLATKHIDQYKNQYVKMSVGIKKDNLPPYLPRQVYESELKAVNYLMFFFPIQEYIFRASGAVIDTIAFEKPIIVLRHPFFENLFQQGGDIGYICESLTEMKQLIININSNETAYFEKYQNQVNNLKNLKVKFSVNHIIFDIEEQLKQ